MLTKFRLHKFGRPLILLTVAGFAVAPAHAQTQTTPAAPQNAPTTAPHTPIFDITPTDARRTSFNVHANWATTLALIEELAKQGGKKVLLSDEMRARPVGPMFELEFQDISLVELMNYLSKQANFSWGIAGDTWLIVPTQTQQPLLLQVPAPLLTVPQLIPAPSPRSPGFTYPSPYQAAPSRTPPNGQPFQFNGGTYYVVPLTPAKTDGAK